ncbi:transglycosylase SLT domain-containing protein [Pasteurellaceae bacterium 20609_3]|uniref:transglycosylase SLT domain-containing protein n=1 Tax=Spirabiliibacterium mucosae TaxID=28156 RepID=UPI001AAD65CF|nr:transglycosylase SLT domain-containing protein [Spirabiliibacterium mucosae]
MRRIPKAVIFSLLIASPLAQAQTNAPSAQESGAQSAVLDLPTQRALYQKTAQLLPLAAKQQNFALIDTMLAKLEGYVLTPFLQYQRLLLEPAALNEQRIDEFAQAHPEIADRDALNRTLLEAYFKQQRWQAVSDFLSRHPLDDQASQCIGLSAQLRLAEGNTNVWQAVSVLWQTGQSLPNQCDDVLNAWQAQAMTPQLLRKRGHLAFLAGSDGLLRHLRNLATGDDMVSQNYLESLVQLREHPEQLPVFVQTAAITPETRAVVDRTFPRFLKKLDVALLNADDPFAEFAPWVARFDLNEEQIASWKAALVSKIFDQDNAQLQAWRDAQVQALRDDALTERRLRTALLNQADLSPWLALLSADALDKQEWRYWQAINDEKHGKSPRSALSALAQERGFYPMLAAQTLGQTYQPHFAKLSDDQREPLLAPLKVRLAQLQELITLEQTTTANRLWQQLLAQGEKRQQIALADYANAQGWYAYGVQATIAAKAWDYIPARLPQAFDTWFDINLAGKQVTQSFAQAIARQESAWNPAVTSSADARGLMQLLPSTAKQTAQVLKLPYSNAQALFSPFDNIMLGTAHLQQLAERFGGNRILMASAYNAGSRRAEQWLARAGGRLSMAEFIATIPYFETRGYVQNVLTYDYYYQLLRKGTGISFAKSEVDRVY